MNKARHDLETERAALAELSSKHNAAVLANAIEKAATAAHIIPQAIPDVLAIGKSELELHEDGSIQTRDGRPLESWLESRKAVSGYWWPLSRGSGARMASDRPDASAFTDSGNPWSKESFSLTQQLEIFKSNPAKAVRVQEAARQQR